MSKKVLKLAGQRPMLLALFIMATLTLGLLLSGWLTPSPSRAQQSPPNPPPNNENTNCPNVVTNAPSVSCPSITNNGAIAPASFCVNEGSSLPLPQLVTSPGATAGSVITSTTETCSNITTYATNTVSYSFSGLKFNPSPATFNVSKPNTYQSDCYIVVTSSDTNDCAASPGTIDYGMVTWNVVDTNTTSLLPSLDINKLCSAISSACSTATSASKVVGCSGSAPTIKVKGDLYRYHICCNPTNGPYLKTGGSVTLTVGWPDSSGGTSPTNLFSCPIPGLSIPSPDGIITGGAFVTCGFTASATAAIGIAQPCQTEPVCLTYNISGTLGVGLQGGVNLSGYLTASAKLTGTASASYAFDQASDGTCENKLNLGKCDVNFSVEVSALGFTWTPVNQQWTLWDGVTWTQSGVACQCF